MVACMSRIELKHFRFVIKIPETVLVFYSRPNSPTHALILNTNWDLCAINLRMHLFNSFACLHQFQMNSFIFNFNFQFFLMNWIETNTNKTCFKLGVQLIREVSCLPSRKQLITENWSRYVWVIPPSVFGENRMNNAHCTNTCSYTVKCYSRKHSILCDVTISFEFSRKIHRDIESRCQWECWTFLFDCISFFGQFPKWWHF